MVSCVTELYDYTRVPIPEEMRRWRVSEEKIDQRLELLSRNHALEKDMDTVCPKDSVACRGVSRVDRWNRETLLFFPGYGLCEKVIEDALLGMQPGQSRTVAAEEGEVTLTVKRIVRRTPHPIDDELVKLENIEGVETLADYRRWYRQTTEATDRKQRVGVMARHILQELQKNSVCRPDPDEELAWAAEIAEMTRQADEANGIDPTVPEEGFDFLTEEQVREKYIAKCRPLFRNMLVSIAVAVTLTGRDEETIFQAEIRQMAEKYYHMEPREFLEKYQIADATLRYQIFFNKAEEVLRQRCETMVED